MPIIANTAMKNMRHEKLEQISLINIGYIHLPNLAMRCRIGAEWPCAVAQEVIEVAYLLKWVGRLQRVKKHVRRRLRVVHKQILQMIWVRWVVRILLMVAIIILADDQL